MRIICFSMGNPRDNTLKVEYPLKPRAQMKISYRISRSLWIYCGFIYADSAMIVSSCTKACLFFDAA